MACTGNYKTSNLRPANGKQASNSMREKEEEEFPGGMVKMGILAWQLNVRFNKLVAKKRHQINLHTK